MKTVAAAGGWRGFAGAPSLAHWHEGQGPAHMGLVARSEAPEPEVGGACDGHGILQSSPHLPFYSWVSPLQAVILEVTRSSWAPLGPCKGLAQASVVDCRTPRRGGWTL